jgi:hypothetical protein
MTVRGLIARIPIWWRVSGIIALVLIGVFLSTTLLNATGASGGHGTGGGGGHGTQSGTPAVHGSQGHDMPTGGAHH